MGFCARDVGGTSDGHFAGWGVRIQGSSTGWWLHYKYYSSPTTIENTPTIDGRRFWPQRLFWVRQELAGTYKRFYCSADGVNWIKWLEDSYSNYNTPSQFGIFIDPMNNAQKVSLTPGPLGRGLSNGADRPARHPDSLLANVQLAFAGADAAPPSLTTQSGRLGGQLGNSVSPLAA